MARFKFRLATLLRLREATRDERRAQLAQAYRADEIVRQKQEEVDAELRSLLSRSREAAAPGQVDVDLLVEARRWELVLQAQQEHLRQQREMVRTEIERRRQALTEANREVRVLEQLRTRLLQRHQKEENRREIKQLDEAAGRLGRKEDDR